MKKLLGITGLFIAIFAFTALQQESFISARNIENLLDRTGLLGILGIGVAFVIITGGIDLSIGSVVGLVGCMLPMFVIDQEMPVPVAILLVILISAGIGLAHGLLITKLKLQPFIVTLCGLLIYRGIGRFLTADKTMTFGSQHAGLREWATGNIDLPVLTASKGFSLPMPFLILFVLMIIGSVFLNKTVWGRYLLALGRNEQAARYSGIKTDRLTILAYVICSTLAGFGGILFMLDLNTVQPSSHGNFFELYAIAAAVLGGCSLRGGEGSIVGAVIGMGILQMLRSASLFLEIPDQLEFTIIGTVILLGAIADELGKRVVHRMRQAKQNS
ncbi:ABC transporter permease [Planctomycetaceae bacterium]|jgi:ribose transport system permease protein|nr:ABC transporter permease [Planctomycetaceae bacterium]